LTILALTIGGGAVGYRNSIGNDSIVNDSIVDSLLPLQ
jgi:hypothetical protein